IRSAALRRSSAPNSAAMRLCRSPHPGYCPPAPEQQVVRLSLNHEVFAERSCSAPGWPSRSISIEEIARLVGHASTRTTEVVYRRELRPVITTGAEIMDQIFQPKHRREASAD